jgi:hypothetical protein
MSMDIAKANIAATRHADCIGTPIAANPAAQVISS